MAVYGRLLIALLLGGICNAESVHYGPLPVFNVSGTHYEVAMAIVGACMLLYPCALI